MTWLALIHSLWILSAVLLGIMPVIMFKRGWHRELPVFFSYLIFHAFQSWILLAIHNFFHDSYTFSYWLFEFLDAAMGFAVIYEIFSQLLKPYPSVRQIGILLIRWATGVLVLIAAVSAGVAPGNNSVRLVAAILAGQRSVFVVQCGLLFFLFMFASSLGLTWRHHVFGLALGFGLCASIELVAATMRAHFGDIDHFVYSIIRPGSYDCAVLIWMGYLLTSEKPVPVLQRPSRDENELELWNNALLELLYNR
jgi:hypothetical protein